MSKMLSKSVHVDIYPGCGRGCCLHGRRPRRVARKREKRQWQREIRGAA